MSFIDIGENFLGHVVFGTEQREKLAEKGEAKPDGGFPIRNRADLKRAIQAYGRAKNKVATKAWIIKRAKELDAVDLLPEDWKTAEHSADDDDILEHHGVKGQKWGVRRSKSQLSKGRKGKKSAKDLSDDDLKKAVNRLNMEQQYTRLTGGRNKSIIGIGAAFVSSIAVGILKTQVTNAANTAVTRAFAARAARAAAEAKK